MGIISASCIIEVLKYLHELSTGRVTVYFYSVCSRNVISNWQYFNHLWYNNVLIFNIFNIFDALQSLMQIVL